MGIGRGGMGSEMRQLKVGDDEAWGIPFLKRL